MAVFEKSKIKKNFPFILLMIVAIVILVIIEEVPSKLSDELETLGDDQINVNKLVINEIMTSNKGAYADETGSTYDWIELYNGTSKDINLSGYGLSDEDSGNTKWIFPDAIIKSNEYLVVFLAGTNADGMYANFALRKSGGETLTLKKKSGKVVDSVRTKSIPKNTVMARNSNGKWIETEDITPGYANNTKGREKYLAELVIQDDLVISEFLPNNKGNISFDGNLYGYIELQNKGSKNISLKDYNVSNDINRPFLYKLPDVELKPDETYLIYTSSLNHDNHADFSLKSKTGVVILSKANKIVEKVEYKGLTNGYAYIKMSDGTFEEATNITPGYPNTTSGMEMFSSKERKNPSELIINEAMSSNREYLIQNGGEYYDWIELYNNTNQTINLNQYSITTDDDNKKMYQLPNKELKAGEYYILMASGNPDYSNSKYYHTNFKISPTESLYLYKNNILVDSMFISNIPIGYSFGRGTSSGLYYFETPTPGKKNSGKGILEIAYTPSFTQEPGVYDNKKELAVGLKGEGTIYYTLDGSIPTTKSKVYNSPIVLNKTTVIKAVAYVAKKKVSAVLTGTYFINENHTLPVLSISLPDASFTKIQTNPNDTKLTVPAHAELYEKDKSFSIDCGLKLFGGSTRFLPKKSFSLKFSSKYGPSSLAYKVFENRDAVNYDTLVVRSGSQDSTGAMIRDELATSLMDDYGTVDVQAYKAVILYINGQYWGIYFIREKVDEEFVAHHYNVPEEGTNIIRIDNNVSAGTSKDYRSLVSYIRNHNLADDANYKYVESKLDIDNFIDFWVGELFTTNNDIVNTRFFNNPKLDNGKIKMIFYDFDYAFYNYANNYMQWIVAPTGLGKWNYDNSILRGLLQNKSFRKRFVERVSWNLKNVWSKEKVDKRYNELINLIKPEMERNQKRWNLTMSTWKSECAILENYLDERRAYMINHTKSYFNLSSKEVKQYFE